MNQTIKLDAPTYAMLDELAKRHYKPVNEFASQVIEKMYFEFKKTHRKLI